MDSSNCSGLVRRLFLGPALVLLGLALGPRLDAQVVPFTGPLIGQSNSPTPVVVNAWTGQVISVGNEAGKLVAGGGTQGIDTAMCFDNIVLSGLSAAPPIGSEIVDWGVKGCIGTGFVTRLAVGYSTSALDPSFGGPGASFGIALYRGTSGFGVLGMERARFSLQGLPGARVSGQAASFALFLDFGNQPLYLPDGNIGWGFQALDGLTGPLLALAPDPSLGTQDLLDLYIPAPATPASYITTGPPFPGQNSGSIAFQIEELLPEPLASSLVDPGNGSNPLVLDEIQRAKFGSTWVGKVDLLGFPGASITVLAVSEGPYVPINTAFGELLVNIADPNLFTDIGFGLHAQAVIPRVDLIGRMIRVQAAIVLAPSGLQFTNALEITIGF